MNSRIISGCKAALICLFLLLALCGAVCQSQTMDSDIWSAAKAGDIKGVTEWLQKGGDINVQNDKGFTLLHGALWCGRSDLAIYLIKAGADLNLAEKTEGYSPLHMAAMERMEPIVSALITKGANVNAVDKDQGTPLHTAAWESQASIVALLISNGADVNAKNKDGLTPLHAAAARCL